MSSKIADFAFYFICAAVLLLSHGYPQELPPSAVLPSTPPSTNVTSVDTTSITANPTASTLPSPPLMDADFGTKCECAVFNNQSPLETDVPILSQMPISVSCDAAGEEKCLKLCSALAEAAKESGPHLLCSSLGHYKQLKASVFSRTCRAKSWTFTGLTSPTDICCHEKKLIACKSLPENPSPNQL